MQKIYVSLKTLLTYFWFHRSEAVKQIDGYHDCAFKKFDIKQYGSEKNAYAAAQDYKAKVLGSTCNASKRLLPLHQTEKKNEKRTYQAVAVGQATGIFFKK